MTWTRTPSLALALFALLMALAAPAPGQRQAKEPDWDAETKRAIMAFFRDRLAVGLGDEPAELPESLRRQRKSEGVLALWHGHRKVAQAEAAGESVAEMCEHLARAMARALWQSEGGADALETGILKLDYVLERKPTQKRLDMPALQNAESGLVGFVIQEPSRPLRGEGRRVWFTPLDVLRAGQSGNLIESLYEAEGGTAPSRWRAERLRTYAIAEKSPQGPVARLYRGGALREDLTADDVQPAFMAAAAWLMATQDASGQFLQNYDPFTGRVGGLVRSGARPEPEEYSMMDHLRAVEPLIRVYDAVDDHRLLEAAERALRFARERVMTIQEPTSETFEIEEGPPRRLEEICYVGEGPNVARATAIMLAAECRMAQAKRQSATALMRRLGRTLVHFVDEHGHMGFSVRDLMRGDTPHSQDNDVPGRTIYALCLLYELDPREEWLTAATRIGLARLAPQGARRFVHDPWDIIGLAMLYRIQAPDSHRFFTGEYVRRRPEYINMAELRQRFCTGAYVHGAGLLAAAQRDRQWLLDRASGKPVNPRHELSRELRYYWPGASAFLDFQGGFVVPQSPPQVMDTAMRLRALAAVYEVMLIKSPDDITFRETIRHETLPICRFLIQQQFEAGTSFFFDAPEVVEGAFRESPTNYHVRMATTAETVLALMEALKVLAIEDVQAPEASRRGRR